MENIELDYVSIYYKEPIVHLIFKGNVELGFPEIREVIKHVEKISGYKPYFVLSDVRKNMNVTHEGRRIVANINESPLHKGNAVLVRSAMLKPAGEFFIRFTKPEYPFAVFTQEEEALQWLFKLPLEK